MVGKTSGKTYTSKKAEINNEFSEAGWWLGLFMEMSELRKFVWCDKREDSDQSILFADMYNNNRHKAIKYNVEKISG